jgi:hypothetical protein
MSTEIPCLRLRLELDGDDVTPLARSAFSMLTAAGLQVRISEMEAVAGAKGAPVDFGTILLAAISTGTVKVMIELIRCLIERNPAVKIRITHETSTVEIDASKVARKQEVALLESLLGAARA